LHVVRVLSTTTKEAALRTLVVASIVAGIAAVTLVSACDSAPADSKQTLKALSATRVFAVPPPGATEIGSAQDPGSTSSITGHDPGVEEIFATAQSIGDVVSYYERTYPQHRFTQNFAPVPQKQLFGIDGWANILINVSPGPPDPASGLNVRIKLSPAPPTATTYVVVVVSGQEPAPATRSPS
jgi:hypothetical protein